MRSIPTDLYNDILSGEIARTVKVTYKNGTVFGFTDHDQELVVDGVTFKPEAGMQSVDLVATSTVEVSSQMIGAGWVEIPEDDIKGGLLDGASIEASWVSWKNPSHGRLVVFLGKVDNITYTADGFKAEIMSFMKQLERTVGTTYTSTCRHKLFGTAEPGKIGFCGLNSTAYTFTGSVATVVTNKWKFTASGLSNPDGYFSSGLLTFTSGLNNGLTYQLKSHAAGNTMELFLRTVYSIQVGDTFTVRAGCDKTLETCKTKFSNSVNYGGFPHINPNINYR